MKRLGPLRCSARRQRRKPSDLDALLAQIELLSDAAAVTLLLIIGKHRVQVGDLDGMLGVARTTVQAILQRLRSAGLISPNREGRVVQYTLSRSGQRARRSLLRLARRANSVRAGEKTTCQNRLEQLGEFLDWFDTPDRMAIVALLGTEQWTIRAVAEELKFSPRDVRENLQTLELVGIVHAIGWGNSGAYGLAEAGKRLSRFLFALADLEDVGHRTRMRASDRSE